MQSAIPLRIKSSLAPESPGTLINKQGASKGIKAVTVVDDVALISIEGRGLMGSIGIDGRIFSALGKHHVNIRLISQASSERGIGFVVNKEDAQKTEYILNKEFEEETRLQNIASININKDVAIIAIVGRHNYALEKAIHGLRKNKIWMHLISNSISGEHISLVVDSKKIKKAVKVVHNEVFGVVKRLYVFAFGKGNVGGTMLDQIINTPRKIILDRGLEIKIIGVADSTGYIFNEKGIGADWRKTLASQKQAGGINQILPIIHQAGIENVVIADNTSSLLLAKRYIDIVNQGFDIVASNKKANSIDYTYYANLRKALKHQGRSFHYETNVGAGLPIIDTIRQLHQSSDKITKIKGVFSGSLSYLFNNFSKENLPFSTILLQAKEKGLTEPDPRDDLSGTDVARKLIILAREVGLTSNYEEVIIENLIPKPLQNLTTYEDFISKKESFDQHYTCVKEQLDNDQVLRYRGEMDVTSGKLNVSLVKVDRSSPLGNINGADSIFEIYTEGYGSQPIIVQGAGAGAGVTARGVYSDLLKLG